MLDFSKMNTYFVQRGTKWYVSLAKQEPSKARQSSKARARKKFSQPRTSLFVSLCRQIWNPQLKGWGLVLSQEEETNGKKSLQDIQRERIAEMRVRAASVASFKLLLSTYNLSVAEASSNSLYPCNIRNCAELLKISERSHLRYGTTHPIPTHWSHLIFGTYREPAKGL